MSRIDCRGGHTQIRKVLRHAINETKTRKVQALVYVGDCMEEKADDLCALAEELGLLGVPAFVFQEGSDPGNRAADGRGVLPLFVGFGEGVAGLARRGRDVCGGRSCRFGGSEQSGQCRSPAAYRTDAELAGMAFFVIGVVILL